MQDIRDAFRALKAAPIVSAVAILSLALGIGANTAIFSILDSLVLVNETFSRRFYPGRSPLGERIREVSRPGAESPAREIVGVVKDAVYASLRQPVPATMYQPLAQADAPPSSISISVRAAGGTAIAPMALSRTVGAALTSVLTSGRLCPI